MIIYLIVAFLSFPIFFSVMYYFMKQEEFNKVIYRIDLEDIQMLFALSVGISLLWFLTIPLGICALFAALIKKKIDKHFSSKKKEGSK